ncbi:MAG: GNAT family N-acetyltransferase [Humidesulfovibrio sp.]
MDFSDSMNAVAIQPAAPGDWPEILAVLQTANMHHIPSPEVPELDLACTFVARLEGRVVGVAGYKVLSASLAKTTLLAVLPEVRRHGVGRRLQERRMDALCELGIRTLSTNSDRPETIAWYEKHFGYVRVGSLPKLHPFGHEGIAEWTTLETDLTRWRKAP